MIILDNNEWIINQNHSKKTNFHTKIYRGSSIAHFLGPAQKQYGAPINVLINI